MRKTFPAKLLGALLVGLLLVVVSGEILAGFDQWRRNNDRGNRYEGRIEIPVGAPDMELLSFVGCRDPYMGDATLKIRFFLPSIAPVFIHGRELREQKQYWMESKPTNWQPQKWNEFGPWPTRDVLTREGIPWSNLGVVIRLHSATTNSGELQPAFVYHRKLPPYVEKYTLYLRPNTTLKKVTSSLYTKTDNFKLPWKASSLLGEKIAGEPFLIELDVRDLAEGPVRLEIRGAYKDRIGGPLRNYTFYHIPQMP